MINDSFSNFNFQNKKEIEQNNLPIQSMDEQAKLQHEFILKYTTLTLKQAEQNINTFEKDNYVLWGIPSASIAKLISPSLNLKDEIFSYDEDNFSIYYGQKNKKSQKHGLGVLLINNGEKYEGYWENDMFKPYGRYINVKGEVYEGSFDNGKLHGEGMLNFQDKCYKGTFFYGIKNGKGIETSTEEDYEGDFKNDKKDGKGILIFKQSFNTYSGDFKDGKLTGNGEFAWKSGDKYVGTITNGVFEGKGKYYWKDGNYYEGNYENGIRRGLGLFKWADGRVYKGEFDNNVPHGNGIIIDNGNEKQVRFNKGTILKVDRSLTLQKTMKINTISEPRLSLSKN